MVKNGSPNPRNGKKWQAILFVSTVEKSRTHRLVLLVLLPFTCHFNYSILKQHVPNIQFAHQFVK